MVACARIAPFAAAVALGGCYDLERLDPGPESYYLLIDDFEDGDHESAASQFSSWRGEPFNPESDVPDRLYLVQGNDSTFAYVIDFHLEYPRGPAYSGMNLSVPVTHDPLDARVFRNFNFAARFVPSTPFPEVTEFYVQLGCDGAPRRSEEVGPPFWIERNIELGPEWQAQSLSIDAFGEPSNVPPRIEGGASACLAVVDSVRFTVATILEPGESVTASLSIDDVDFD